MPEPRRFPTDRETLERVCEVEFLRASGPGGQHRNKRETGVRLRHPDAGVVVSATERRSRSQNQSLAFERMAARLEALAHRDAPRVPTRTPRKAHRKRLSEKRRRGEVKAGRQRPSVDD